MIRRYRSPDSENFTVTKENHTMTAPTASSSLSKTIRLTAVAALTFSAFLLVVGSATAAPVWGINSLSNTTAAPGESLTYSVQIDNLGTTTAPSGPGGNSENCIPAAPPPADPAKCYTVKADLPSGMTGVSAESVGIDLKGLASCTVAASEITCTIANDTNQQGRIEPRSRGIFQFTAEVGGGVLPDTILTPHFEVFGGEALAPATTVDPTVVAAEPRPFGIDAFDILAADASGQPLTEAGAHPDSFTTSFSFNTRSYPSKFVGDDYPVETTRDALVDLPPGMMGNPTVAATCNLSDLALGGFDPKPLCSPDSQVGTITPYYNGLEQANYLRAPLYRLVTPPGTPAFFGFNYVGTVVTFAAVLRSSGDYGVTTRSRLIPEGLPTAGVIVKFWGVPAASAHDGERACPGEVSPYSPSAKTCSASLPAKPFFRNPTSCTEPGEGIPSALSIDSWEHPGTFVSRTIELHDLPGFPADESEWGSEHGIESCDEVPFSPSLASGPPSGAEAAEPSGFSFDLTLPQAGLEEVAATSESDLRKAVVTLPEGVRVNPSSADGLGSCSPAQVGLLTAVGQAPHFAEGPGNCPDSSKIGLMEVETPLLDHKLTGGVYLAQPQQNPFGSFLAIYLVTYDPVSGVTLKLAGKVDVDPHTGQITTTFDENPQVPFLNLHLELKSGQRAALVAPRDCGTYTTHSTFTGWNGETVNGASSFTVNHGCLPSGFSPQLHAGVQDANAGNFSPFSVRLTRSDADQEISKLAVHTPANLTAKLAGIPWCPESAIAAAAAHTSLGDAAQELAVPSCPASSQVGTVTVGAGAGVTPFYLSTGKAYLAGPYKGANDSIVFITPVAAGPFDLGNTVIRAGLNVDPVTARVTTAADPLPTILDGIPLEIRDIRVNLNRPEFTMNGTSCDPTAIEATVQSIQGTTATPSQRFQLANCDKLGFKPKLSLRLSGSHTRTGNPALTATLTMPPGGANLAHAQVALPPTELLDNAHIGTVCTRVQYAAGAGGGEQCPARSLIGHIRAVTPLLPLPLEGSIYLRSNPEHELPDIVASLDGRVHIDAAARVDSSKAGGLRTTFESIPDVPVSEITVSLQGAKKGLIQNNTNICRGTHRGVARFDAQNGRTYDFNPKVKPDCGKKHRRGHR